MESKVDTLIDILKKNLQPTPNEGDLSDESEQEIYNSTRGQKQQEVSDNLDVGRKPTHQKFCIRCGSADNLFRTNKYKTCVQCCNKKTRPPPSEKQIEGFKKCREKRMENIQKRKEALKEFEEKIKSEMENKIVKKAISIKKKQILREDELEEFSDDDTPLEEVVKVAKKRATKQTREKAIPQYEEEQQPQRKPRQTQQQQPQQTYQPQVFQPVFSFA